VDRMRSVVLWTLAALAGILVAAGITLAASSLSSQQIGLSAEPLSAGDALVPATPTAAPTASKTPEQQKKKRRAQRTATPAPTATAVPTVRAEPGDDHGGNRGSGSDDGGGGSGKGRGGGGGDDD
jgi:hypothetical protein